MEKFYLGDYINEERRGLSSIDESRAKSTDPDIAGVTEDTHKEKERRFEDICSLIYEEFRSEWESENNNIEMLLEIQKKAIMGCAPEVDFFKKKISEYLKKHDLEKAGFPDWYETLEDGIYHENWGVASIAEWFTEKYRGSSSAKIIGDRVYFLENGRMQLKPQKINAERREQLVRSFLMMTPEERLDRDFHEVYMEDGTRITVFRRNMVKKGQDVIIFRRYIVPSYSFEEQASRGTIPYESLDFFKAMAKLGFNVAFTGAVRTAKSTFLSTWQTYEKKELEGVMVETDPEIPMHRLMPEAPVVQLIADGEKLSAITKNLLRSDADYFIMAEARDGNALDTVLRAAAKGTRRMKITFHTREPLDFPYDVASEIVDSVGGDIGFTARRAASSFDYIFHFIQLSDKSQKRLNAIYEMGFNREKESIEMKKICGYDILSDSWKWDFHISAEKRRAAEEEDRKVFSIFEREFRKLAGTAGIKES